MFGLFSMPGLELYKGFAAVWLYVLGGFIKASRSARLNQVEGFRFSNFRVCKVSRLPKLAVSVDACDSCSSTSPALRSIYASRSAYYIVVMSLKLGKYLESGRAVPASATRKI